jgi:hypothetical protein
VTLKKRLLKYLAIIVVGSLVLLWIGCSNTTEIISSSGSDQGDVPYHDYSNDGSQQTDDSGTTDDGSNQTYDSRETRTEADGDPTKQEDD